jgi:hypothetical protein
MRYGESVGLTSSDGQSGKSLGARVSGTVRLPTRSALTLSRTVFRTTYMMSGLDCTRRQAREFAQSFKLTLWQAT